MPYKNPKELLLDAVKFPVAIEGMLPEAAPKLSANLTEIAGKITMLPDFVVEVPDLPEAPAAPAALRLGRGVREVEERKPPAPPRRARTRFLY